MLSFMLFAFVASITPGPTNILVLSNSARYGLKATLPIILGACFGAAGLVLLVGTGLGQSLAHWPNVQMALQWMGGRLAELPGLPDLQSARTGHRSGCKRKASWPDRRRQPAVDQPENLDDGARGGECICRPRCRAPEPGGVLIPGVLPDIDALPGDVGAVGCRRLAGVPVGHRHATSQPRHGLAAVSRDLVECAGLNIPVIWHCPSSS